MKLKLIKFNSVKSTNDQAIKIIKSKKNRNGIVISYMQTKGKGTMGKKWVSQKGNIFASIFFELKKTLPNFKQISLINPLIVKRVLKDYSSSKIQIKWPNDLLIKSKKVCGILQEIIEFEKKNFLIIGIGINTISSPTNVRFKSISLNDCSKKFVDNKKIIKKLKTDYENIFQNYKFNKKFLKK